MNLGFSAEHEAIRDEFRKVLAGADPRAGFEAEQGAASLGDARLWQRLAELGWLATLVPEAHGGSGLEPVVACVLAEEIGRSLAPVPFTSSACAFTHGLGLVANADCAELFARLAEGSARGLLLTDDCWLQTPKLPNSARRRGATLSGRALNVLDGAAATHALAFAGSGTERLWCYPLDPACRRRCNRSIWCTRARALSSPRCRCRCWRVTPKPSSCGIAWSTATLSSSRSSSSAAPRPHSTPRGATASTDTPSAARSDRSRRSST
jgi:hypothetical protein